MKFIDLFSGIGGFRLGMEMAGHECVGHCEIDKFANRSYAAMHKPKRSEWYAEDIRTVEPWDLPEADCYCGGFPCQAFSVAGKRGGFEDTRGTLFFEIMRIARVRKPKYLFLENVKGLLSHDGGRTFGTILKVLWECGYDAEWQMCNSKDFGVPQNRERVFVVGHLRGGCTGQVFPVTGENSNVIKQFGNIRITTKRKNPSVGRVYAVDGLSPCLTTMRGGDQKPIIIIQSGKSKQDVDIRYITPRECFRLQGFPDEYFDRAAAVNSDSQLYKQAGNSVTVSVIYNIAKKLERMEESK